MALSSTSLERLVPDDVEPGDATGTETLALHVARYEFAARRVPAGRLLDVGCGVGYGAALLAGRKDVETRVVGVDISPEVVAYARERYGAPQIDFRVGNVMSFEDAAGFDGIVALEIVEHVDEPETLVERLATLLRPEGVLVASVPTTPSTDFNPHHRHDFTERSFRGLFSHHGLVETDCLRQKQRVPLGAVLHRREARMKELRSGLGSYYLRNPMTLFHRVQATVTHGFVNCYTTIAWRKLA